MGLYCSFLHKVADVAQHRGLFEKLLSTDKEMITVRNAIDEHAQRYRGE